MPCYKPLLAWKTAAGNVVFVERMGKDVVRELSLPCGQCIGCRLEKSRDWAMRCMHEASMHERNCFLTLTYSDEYLPVRGQLEYATFQKFMKRLRKYFDGGVRFYMCGEYGEENGRPHYHACLFGVDFDDKIYLCQTPTGERLYRSALLERLWYFGNSSIGSLTFESAAYVARYCVQKVTGRDAKSHYARSDGLHPPYHYQLEPEFNGMSLKPGIGAPFLEKWKTDIYPNDYVIVNGKKMMPPPYYDKIFKREKPDEWEVLQWKREERGRQKHEDNTDARLRVKEEVAHAKANLLKRGML